MNTKVYFSYLVYGNYLDNYYTENTEELINSIIQAPLIFWEGNLGIQDGVSIINNFAGNFREVNCAVIDHEIEGICLYKIIKKEFKRRDIWTITMRKDVISHKLREIKDSKVLVSRLGMDRTIDSPILMVEEPMQLSQVKHSQVSLSDNSLGIYGIALFFAKDTLSTELGWKYSEQDVIPSMEVFSISEWGAYNNRFTKEWVVRANGAKNTDVWKNYFSVEYYSGFDTGERYGFGCSVSKNGSSQSQTTSPVGTDFRRDSTFATSVDYLLIKSNIANALIDKGYGALYSDDVYNLGTGDIIKETSTGNFYRVTRYEKTLEEVYTLSATETYNAVMSGLSGSGTVVNNLNFVRTETYIEYSFTEISGIDGVYDYSLEKQGSCIDQPFDIVYVPYVEGVEYMYGGLSYKSDIEAIYGNIYSIISAYSGENGSLIDAQIISYVPDFIEREIVDGRLALDNLPINKVIVEGEFAIPFISLYECNYSKNIICNIEIEDYKLEQKNSYMISSPSGAGNYEFAIYKNGGVSEFIVDVNLRPYSSYYRVQPLFSKYYGENYNDTRGLIWQEDMSLTLTSSAWETYKRQNVNYMNSFNTNVDYEVSQLGLQHDANKMNYTYDSAKRILEGVVEGTSTAIIGGIAGSVGGAIGGAASVGMALGVSEGIEYKQMLANNEAEVKLLENTLANSRLQFNYGLSNIRALPENTGKVTGVFSSNNYIPYIQIFKPTEEEVDYYKSYLDINGVNVGMMVDLNEYEFNYLQGTVLKYSSAITIEEYEEIVDKLQKGIRKVN